MGTQSRTLPADIAAEDLPEAQEGLRWILTDDVFGPADWREIPTTAPAVNNLSEEPLFGEEGHLFNPTESARKA